ncbi:MAG: zf-HC2 domain-containing protein [Elusimicrobia bacterium]|nr:zf-HC2 domain-containing protein [Elusimicrobiota bacterium]
MTSCDKIIQDIWQFLDHELDEVRLAEFKKHLDLCRTCFTRAEFEQLLRDHCKKKTEHICPEKLKVRIQQIIEYY